MDYKHSKIAVIGLGYVGLPLAVEFGKKRDVIGYDISERRIKELSNGFDATLETSGDELKSAGLLTFTMDTNQLRDCQIFIVTVPTPIDEYKKPDLSLLLKASSTIGKSLKKGDIVIYESTVYPGATEEDCVPVLERESGLIFNKDFFCGYSPERINPGDKSHRLSNITKITSGSTPEIAVVIDRLYQSIVTVGTHLAPSIKIAEAAKVIENTQRDVNIALINELAILFSKMNISTKDVLEAASTKWNFLPFKPGLVGGHCIGVDPYYLTHKAQSIGYHPEMILAGRRINDGMGDFIASTLVKKMLEKSIQVLNSNILVMGLTFKENCPDLRNTKVVDLIHSLQSYNVNIDVVDPWCDKSEAWSEYSIEVLDEPKEDFYDAIVLAVAHDEFKHQKSRNMNRYGKGNHILYDLKYIANNVSPTIRL